MATLRSTEKARGWVHYRVPNVEDIDHGELAGLDQDDHPQYLNEARGDARYYTEAETDALLAGKSDTSHTHDDRYYTETELDAGQLDTRYYTETEVDTLLAAQDELSELGDVTLTTPTTGSVLYKSGTDWVNTDAVSIDPAGAVELEYNGSPVVRTTASGMHFAPETGTTNAQFSFYDAGFVDEQARFAFNEGTNDLFIRGEINSANIQLRSLDSGGVATVLANLDPDGSTDLYYGGSAAFTTTSNGASILPSTQSATVVTPTSDARLHICSVFGLVAGIASATNSTVARRHNEFENPNGVVGSITTSGSSTAFNTTSDGRLKTDLGRVPNALESVRVSPVHQSYFTGRETATDARPMFFAEEMFAIAPEAVTVSELEHVPNMMDYSKLVPRLWAAVQELSEQVDALEELVNGTNTSR